VLFPVVVALLAAERRIAMLERRLGDARWLGPDEGPSEADKELAKRRVRESLGAWVALSDDTDSGPDDDYLAARARATASRGESTPAP
jgi:hypothetical protein